MVTKAWSLGRIARGILGLGALTLSMACAPISVGGIGGGGTIRVALLVPSGSGQAGDEVLGQSLENAARLAIQDLGDTKVQLMVYGTGGQPAQAAAMAKKAVADGAQVILGPVFAQEANAAGVAVAGSGVNVLAFSNNPDIAGGNVFILGPTFQNTAERLASYAVRTGKSKFMIASDRNIAGQLGRDAIKRGALIAGATVVAEADYEFSQNGIVSAAPQLAAQAKSSGAQAMFLTADTAGALPLLSQMLLDNGLRGANVQFVGLTRWDIPQTTLALPGVQGGLFAMPDPGRYSQFVSRYNSAYGAAPHPIAALGYDGIAALGALASGAGNGPVTRDALMQAAGFVGVNGVFRLLGDGTNQRGLAVAQVQGGKIVIVESAPDTFGLPGL
ncbi:MAG: penicillin-binding protein activator [Cypionkella sp.]|nr:penicillin-binding protein activator [Cypionkella sp.]